MVDAEEAAQFEEGYINEADPSGGARLLTAFRLGFRARFLSPSHKPQVFGLAILHPRNQDGRPRCARCARTCASWLPPTQARETERADVPCCTLAVFRMRRALGTGRPARLRAYHGTLQPARPRPLLTGHSRPRLPLPLLQCCAS